MNLNTAEDINFFGQDFLKGEWLNSSEAATYLRLLTRSGQPCMHRLRNLVCKGKLPFYKPFGRLMFKRTELEKLIVTSRQGIHNGHSEVLRQKR
jgi:hypothetical protein